MMNITPCETDFNLDRHLISFLQDSPFYAELSRHIHKSPTKSISTAAVTFDEKSDQLSLLWNPDFMSSLTSREINGVLRHEYSHLFFGHLYGRRRKPAMLWNIATDLAINSIIVEGSKNSINSRLEGERALPECALIPGVFPKHPEGREYTEEEKTAMKLATVISKLPTMQSSEWYYEKIKEEMKDEIEKGAFADGIEISIGSMDDHDMWDSVPDELREYVEGKVKAIVEKAVKKADSQANGWGNMPQELIEAIRKSVSNVINWRNVLRQFVGSISRGGRATSIKRINKRYPYIHPGVKRGYEAKLLIAIDQSGSVSNEMLTEFFAELGSLTKRVTVDILPFDTEANEKDLYTWRRGQNITAKRVRGGGTDFNAPTQFANDPKNRGRWDGFLCLTDGQASTPVSSRIKRGWVLGKGCKLYFNTDELQINMENGNNQVQGAWR